MSKKSSASKVLSGVIAAGATVATVYTLFIRPWHLRWGASDEEIQSTYPGDELVPTPRLNATHAITIDAPVERVWPWLAQIGQGRAGFYSYDWIENLMGLEIHNANQILPKYQNLQVGDLVPLAPGGFGIPVALLEPKRALLLHGDTRTDPNAIPGMKPGDYLNVSWGWFLEPLSEQATRLVERWRADWNPSLQNWVFIRAFLEPGAFIMSRKMLLGIKQRAEAAISL